MVRPNTTKVEGSALEATVADRVAAGIEAWILRGAFAPGDRLPSERALAEKLSASRPSVREALQKLEARGLVRGRRGGGTLVCDPAAELIGDPLLALLRNHPDTERDFLEFRALLEQQAAYWAALRATEPDLERLERKLLHLEQVSETTDDLLARADADADFHLAIAECAHNVGLLYVVRALLGALRADVHQNRIKLAAHRGSERTLRHHHRSLFEAIQAGEPERARQAARTHLDYLEETIRGFDHLAERRAVAQVRLEREIPLPPSGSAGGRR